MFKNLSTNIISTGFDVIEIERIRNAIHRFGPRFLQRCFTPSELQAASNHLHQAAHLAKRFAAKEAFVKALKTGFNNGVFFKDIMIVKNPQGDVQIQVAGNARKRLHQMMEGRFSPQVHLSLSDDRTKAYAWVIICS